MIARISLAAGMLLLFVGVARADAPKLEGLYKCVGGNDGGGKYEGRVEIAKKDEVYTMKWTVGEESYVGVAILSDDTLSVAWASRAGGGVVVGVVTYKVEMGGRLTGIWTQLGGDNKIHEETLTKIPDA